MAFMPQFAPLRPNARVVKVVDHQGRAFLPSADGQSALEQAQGKATTPLTQPLKPGESYTTQLVFDLPADIRNPRLLITDADGVARMIIGHESSPLHKKIFFALASSPKSPQT